MVKSLEIHRDSLLLRLLDNKISSIKKRIYITKLIIVLRYLLFLIMFLLACASLYAVIIKKLLFSFSFYRNLPFVIYRGARLGSQTLKKNLGHLRIKSDHISISRLVAGYEVAMRTDHITNRYFFNPPLDVFIPNSSTIGIRAVPNDRNKPGIQTDLRMRKTLDLENFKKL